MNTDQTLPGNVPNERGKKRTVPAPGAENIIKKSEDKKTAETGQSTTPKPRRGRPPKSESQSSGSKKAETSKPAGRGRKRISAKQENPAGLQAASAKVPKLQNRQTKKSTPSQRQMDLQSSQNLGSDGDSLWEIESSPGNSQNIMDLSKACESSQDTDAELAGRDLLQVKRKSAVLKREKVKAKNRDIF